LFFYRLWRFAGPGDGLSSMSLTDKPLEFTCQNCKAKLRTTLAALDRNNNLTCSKCKEVTRVDGTKAPTAALRNLEKTLKNFGKKR
jgi:hypothetical protein